MWQDTNEKRFASPRPTVTFTPGTQSKCIIPRIFHTTYVFKDNYSIKIVGSCYLQITRNLITILISKWERR